MKPDKKLIVLLLALLAAGAVTEMNAQTWVEQLGKKAGEAAKRRVEYKVQQKAEQTVDEVLDGKVVNKKGKAEKDQKTVSGAETIQQQAEPQEMKMEETAPQKIDVKSAEMAYAKSDFVRGDEVIFEDQLTGEQLGEFPSQWDLLDGSLEIARLNGENVIKPLNPGDCIAPLFEDLKSYLPEKFTIEFDFWVGVRTNSKCDIYRIVLDNKEGSRCQDIDFNVSDREEDVAGLNWGYRVSDDSRGGRTDNVAVQRNAWNHFAVSFNKRAMKIYINGTRYANIPNTNKPDNFWIQFNCWGGWEMNNSAIRNIVVAKGAVPLYDRMMTDGKFITYGITFDVGKAVIKPESMGEINRIVTLMNENPDLKFSVEGHTDSTGKAESNQKLSEERSQAIVAKLVELGISKDRLSASGKGQNSPIADNSTDEGRAKNRRVEFVKL